MKLEVGMYIKTKFGIAKYIKNFVHNDGTIYRILDKEIMIQNLENWQDTIVDNQITKEPSFNIIDLIENGDLLTIEYYSERYKERVTRLFEVTYKNKQFINLDNAKCQFLIINKEWSNEDKELNPIIKSIVTKEQFESMKYRIGEE